MANSIPLSHLGPFRDYNEKDVINVFALSGVALPAGNGLVVTVAGGGWIPAQLDVTELLGDYAQGQGQTSFLNNVQAQRYGALPKVIPCQSGSVPLGITLFDVAEFDENGEPLKYNPRKAAEMEAVISGQAVPIVTKGIFQFKNLDPQGIAVTAPAAGGNAYVGANGLITTYQVFNTVTVDYSGLSTFTITGSPINQKIGVFLGGTGTNYASGFLETGYVFVRLSF